MKPLQCFLHPCRASRMIEASRAILAEEVAKGNTARADAEEASAAVLDAERRKAAEMQALAEALQKRVDDLTEALDRSEASEHPLRQQIHTYALRIETLEQKLRQTEEALARASSQGLAFDANGSGGTDLLDDGGGDQDWFRPSLPDM